MELLEKIASVPDFYGIQFKSINETNALGDNALHCVCVWGDLEAAKLLVENGIDINQLGEGSMAPLNMALDFGHTELADYLISQGADTSVIGAEFNFDPEKSKKHLQGMSEEIKKLEEHVKNNCGNA